MTDRHVYDVVVPMDHLPKICRLFKKKQHRGFYLIVEELTFNQAAKRKFKFLDVALKGRMKTYMKATYAHVQIYKEAP